MNTILLILFITVTLFILFMVLYNLTKSLLKFNLKRFRERLKVGTTVKFWNGFYPVNVIIESISRDTVSFYYKYNTNKHELSQKKNIYPNYKYDFFVKLDKTTIFELDCC